MRLNRGMLFTVLGAVAILAVGSTQVRRPIHLNSEQGAAHQGTLSEALASLLVSTASAEPAAPLDPERTKLQAKVLRVERQNGLAVSVTVEVNMRWPAGNPNAERAVLDEWFQRNASGAQVELMRSMNAGKRDPIHATLLPQQIGPEGSPLQLDLDLLQPSSADFLDEGRPLFIWLDPELQ